VDAPKSEVSHLACRVATKREPHGRWQMSAKRDRIFDLVDGWRKEHPGEPITTLVDEISDVTALKSARLKDIRSWLAECESKKAALENEFPHLKRVPRFFLSSRRIGNTTYAMS
jgi:hypothetical protein